MNAPAQHAQNAPAKSLHALLRGIAEVRAQDERAVTGVSMHSGEVRGGELFLALRGDARDGRDYIADAIAGGAIAIAREKDAREKDAREKVTQENCNAHVPHFAIENLRAHAGDIAARFYDHPSANMRVIGITGTNGKTTCAYLLAQALCILGQRCAVMGTLGSGFAGELRAETLTTPNAVRMQKTLAEFRDAHAQAACVEVSSHALQQGRVNGVAFDVAVLTNLSRDHLDYHAGMKSYARAKAKLFHTANLRAAVVNADDDFGRDLARTHAAEKCLRYGMRDGAVRARDVQCDDGGISFAIAYRGKRAQLHSKLIGAVNASNLLACAAALLACGFALDKVTGALAQCEPPPGRMQLLRMPRAPGVVIDYAHTPDALSRALDSLSELCRGKVWVVFGCGGERDRGKRAQMGAIAERGAARVILTDDNPRGEDPAQIAAEIASGMQNPPPVIHDRARAIAEAVAAAAENDFILIAGKGHETTQTTGKNVRAFNDHDAARTALAALAKNGARA